MATPAEPSAVPAFASDPEVQERASRHRRRVRQLTAVAAIVLIATAGVAWATDGFTRSAGSLLGSLGPQCPPTVHLNGTGSTFFAPLMTSWVNVYAGAAATRERGCVVVQPTYNASGAPSGLSRLRALTTEFSVTEQPLNTSQAASLPAPVITLPLAVSGVAVVYHVAGLAGGLNLTASVLAGIYLGTVTTWNDSKIVALNPGVLLPDEPIQVIDQGPGSTTSFVFTGFLSAHNATWALTVGQGSTVPWPVGTQAPGDAAEALLVQATAGSIGFVGLGTAVADALDCADVQNPAGAFVAPTVGSVFAAVSASTTLLPLGNESWQNVSLLDEPGLASYPITSFSYALVYADLGSAYGGGLTLNVAQWLAAFLYWMSVAGQSYGAPLGYAPFDPTVTSANQQIVELLKYNGVRALGDIDYDGD